MSGSFVKEEHAYFSKGIRLYNITGTNNELVKAEGNIVRGEIDYSHNVFQNYE